LDIWEAQIELGIDLGWPNQLGFKWAWACRLLQLGLDAQIRRSDFLFFIPVQPLAISPFFDFSKQLPCQH
jgi:hypothetical protein